MPRVLLIYLKRMAWAIDKGSGEQEGKNIKVPTFVNSHRRYHAIIMMSQQVTRVVDIPSVVSLAPVKAPTCRLPPAQPLVLSSSSNTINISPVNNLLSPVIKNLTANSVLATPSKFSGKTAEELTAMSERDQVWKSGNHI